MDASLNLTGDGRYHADEVRATGSMVGRPEVLRARPELKDQWGEIDSAFPVRVTRSFWDRIDAKDPNDPLGRQVLPDVRELSVEGLVDPVGDAAVSPVPWVVHKYPHTVLLMVTKRCHLYCRYCFRRTYAPGEREEPTAAELDAAVAYISNSGVDEVILSGGDPLSLRDDKLFSLIDRLRPAVRRIRIHSRAPVTKPDRVTERLVAGLAARKPVWMVIHCNHPRELAPDVIAALERLQAAGISLLNQSVLLRGVNDDVNTLVELSNSLTNIGVKPYYLHHPDQVQGASHFGVSVEEGLALYAELRTSVNGVALPRYVIDPPDGGGKVDVERWINRV